jgi:chromosomal replication initiator protein
MTITVDDIQRAVCKTWGITQAEMLSDRRAARVAWPRQAAYYLAKRHTQMSFPGIAKRFAFRDHTTIMDGIARAEDRIRDNSTYAEMVRRTDYILRSGSREKTTADYPDFAVNA